MKLNTAILPILILALAVITAPVRANAFQNNGDGSALMVTADDRGGAVGITLASTAGMLMVPDTRAVTKGEAFISADTIVVGCTAGAAAGALAITLPVLTVASTGVGLPASAVAVAGTAAVGCAVGAVSGLAAIGTAWGLNLISQISNSLAQ
jgi:hypothetical protein